jgi:transcriptional regulator with XRE-family HTH domain
MNDSDQGLDLKSAAVGPRSAVPVDMHVGRRVKARRMLLGMTQEELADQLGVTFQQVQKYEKGVNRVSASRLLQLSTVLRVPVQYFFDERPAEEVARGKRKKGDLERLSPQDIMLSPQGAALIRAFGRIKDEQIRQALVDHVAAVASSLEK